MAGDPQPRVIGEHLFTAIIGDLFPGREPANGRGSCCRIGTQSVRTMATAMFAFFALAATVAVATRHHSGRDSENVSSRSTLIETR